MGADIDWTWLLKVRSVLQKSEVGGGKRSGAETPTGNPSPAPSASAPHARHDRSMARSSSEARAICGLFSYSPTVSQKNVPSIGRVSVLISFILVRFYNGFLQDQLEDQLQDQLSLGSFLFIFTRNLIQWFPCGHGFFRSSESSF